MPRADLTGDDSTWGLFDWKSFSLVPDNRTNVHVEAWNCYKTFLIKFKISLNSLFFLLISLTFGTDTGLLDIFTTEIYSC